MTMHKRAEDPRIKAPLRNGLLARVSRLEWELGTEILRMTHRALITSLLRYGLVVHGSCMPPGLVGKMDTRVATVAARRIRELGRTVQIESLHLLAATYSC